MWGGTAEGWADLTTKFQFQSTHPVWGGTIFFGVWDAITANFNPPTPCGVGPPSVANLPLKVSISIHPPRVGWDQWLEPDGLLLLISIHPPRVGWDPTALCPVETEAHFNPPTPCGVGRGA